MATVVFVNEHRIVEVPSGTNLKRLRAELGMDPHPSSWNPLTCGLFGPCVGCQVWVRPAPGEPPVPRTSRDRIAGMRGERRLACNVTVQGSIDVITLPSGAGRLRMPRPIAPPPRPTVDASARRKPVDAAPTAEFVLGHPSAVGSGTRTAPDHDAEPSPAAKPPDPGK